MYIDWVLILSPKLGIQVIIASGCETLRLDDILVMLFLKFYTSYLFSQHYLDGQKHKVYDIP
jgi:hypothetical protein